MRYKLLGRSGLRVSELCLGTMTFGLDFAWGTPREECQKIVGAFLDAGGNFIDTANTYADAEEHLGELLAGKRSKVVIASKYASAVERNDVNSAGTHRKNLVQSIERSLRRLKTDYIDLLWIHAWDSLTPIEEVVRALDDAVRQGKILYAGVSNAPAWIISRSNTLAELKNLIPFTGLQVEYSLIERESERELIPMAAELGIGVVAWAPLAAGWLTGKYIKSENGKAEAASDSGPHRLDDRFASQFLERTERNQRIAEEVNRIADEIGCRPSHVALNWIRHKGIIPVFGARRLDQAEENLQCLKAELGEDHLERLDQVSSISLGYPHDFLARVRPFIYGTTYNSIDAR